MERILVTGANGMLGQDLCPLLQDFGYDVTETDIDMLDITDFNNVKSVLYKEKPDIVIHCAAYTNVDKAEEEKELAEQVNSIGTKNIAKICSEIDSVLVYISTDYVFDGKKTEPYNSSDIPNPINNYGMTKYIGEEYVKEYCDKYFIVRTSWLYGHHGNNFVEKILSMKNKTEIKVVDDQKGCPTWTVDLSNAILKCIQSDDYGIYHICGGGSATWFEFAKEISDITGLNMNIIPCKSDEYKTLAKRPHYSIIDNNVCRNWKLALKDYLSLRIED